VIREIYLYRIVNFLQDFETDERQCNVIRYASFVAMINLNTYDDIVKGLHGLNDMTKFALDFPAIYLQIARAYYKLNRYSINY
jgi:hypothetical protein